MARFRAVLMHGRREAEGTYTFEAMDDLMRASPVRVMRAFMEWVDANAGLGHVDYELNAAFKNAEKGIVTALGTLSFDDTSEPFICYISRA